MMLAAALTGALLFIAALGAWSGAHWNAGSAEESWFSNPEWWVAIGTLGLFGATCGLWFATYRMWTATQGAVEEGKESARFARESARAAMIAAVALARPRIEIRAAIALFAGRNTLHIQYTTANYGGTPATITEWNTTIASNVISLGLFPSDHSGYYPERTLPGADL